jgi:hypothetical protein
MKESKREATIRKGVRQGCNLSPLLFNIHIEQAINECKEFYISLTVHLGIVIVNNQLDAFFSNVFIYFTSPHVSSNPVLIIRRIELYQYIIWYISLCVGDCFVYRSGRTCREYCTGIKASGMRIQMLRFADDIAIIAQDKINLKRALESLDDVLKSNYRIKINRKKTEVMVCSKDP